MPTRSHPPQDVRSLRRTHAVFGTAASLIAFSQLFSYPGAVRDIDGRFHEGITLAYPLAYTIFAPFFQAADALTILSLRQHMAFPIFLNLLWILARISLRWKTTPSIRFFVVETLKWSGFNLFYCALLALAVLVPRPMAAIQSGNPDHLAVDFHSHTSYSWDARKSFTPLENLRWHKRGGFHAAFLTDHNTFDGAQEALDQVFKEKNLDGIVPMRGEEVSLFQSHWAVLGNDKTIPNQNYDTGMEGIERFLGDMKKAGYIVITSLPEYWLYHWGNDVQQFVDWGTRGFEILNSAPNALDFPPSLKKSVQDLCQAHSLAMTGITDSHGWGSTVYAWNFLEIPGWRSVEASRLEPLVLESLKTGGPDAVLILTRVKREPHETTPSIWIDPPMQIWTCFRAFPAIHRGITLVWIAIFWVVFVRIKKSSKPSPEVENVV